MPTADQPTPGRPPVTELETERLRLRAWRESDRESFAAMNADPEVMRYFPAPLTRAQSDALVDRIEAGFAARGHGLWALELPGAGRLEKTLPGAGRLEKTLPGAGRLEEGLREGGDFIGFTGLQSAPDQFPSAPATEIGWRLARPYWGRGLAPEAARAVLNFAFGPAGYTELVSFTTVTNAPSRRVMEKLGMTRDPADDFVHPLVGDWWGAPHVVYRIDRNLRASW